MPSQAEHLRKARQNRVFFEACEQNEEIKISAKHCEWSIIVRFYECLHIVEAIAATKEIHFPKHEVRNAQIRMWKTLFDSEFANRYVDLYNLSWRARYSEKKIMHGDVADCDAAYTYIRNFAHTKHGLTI